MSAEVDEAIAPLIRALWERGLETSMSCQDNTPGRIWVEFPTAAAAEEFLNALTDPTEDQQLDSLTARVRGAWSTVDADESLRWDYAVTLDDWSFDSQEVDGLIDEWRVGGPDLHFALSVRFPQSDFDEVVRRVLAYRAV